MPNPVCSHCSNPLPEDSLFCPRCGASLGGTTPEAPNPGPAGIWETLIDRVRRAAAPRYEVLELLGYGGMAGVYLAEEPRLGRRVAIKVMAPSLMSDPRQIKRFRQEARATAKLSHPNIVTIHEIDEREGLHYLVMAFIEGESLAEILKSRVEPLPIPQAVTWLRQISAALHHAHRNGVVHRDIKPGNVLLDSDWNALVSDFGIAKISDEPGLTRTGMMVGTPSYMSPEQCMSQEITGATDQYALGILAYEMLTGKPPFTGGVMAVLQLHMTETPESVMSHRPDCPEWLADMVERMLAKDPVERWHSLADLVSVLDRQSGSHFFESDPPHGSGVIPSGTAMGTAPESSAHATPQPPAVTPAGSASPTPPPPSSDQPDPLWRNMRVVAGSGAIILLAAVALVWQVSRGDPTTPSPTPEVASETVAGDPEPDEGGAGQSAEGADAAPFSDIAGSDDAVASDSPDPTGSESPPAGPVREPEPPPAEVSRAPAATPAPARVRIPANLPASALVTASGTPGQFTVSAGGVNLPSGTWTLSFEAPGYLPQREVVSLREGENFEWTPGIERDTPPTELTGGDDPLPVEPDPPAFDETVVRGQVADQIVGFIGAFETREMAAVLRTYPGAPSDWIEEWQPLVENTQAFRDLRTTLGQIEHVSTTPSRAELEFSFGFQYLDFRNQTQSQEGGFRAVLVPRDGSWVIQELTGRRR